MRVTLLGHATVLVEMGPMKILMDPVLQDPFEDGMVVSCPKREIDIEQLPPIDVIIISHRHPDHFDLPSLDRLSRSCQVCCPADPLISHALKLLGFRHVNFLEPGKPLRLEKRDPLPPRSKIRAFQNWAFYFGTKRGASGTRSIPRSHQSLSTPCSSIAPPRWIYCSPCMRVRILNSLKV